jgi:hypothetical protein
MEVITNRPIYNYASGENDFSYLTAEEKALKKKQKQDKAAKRKESLDSILQNDFTKSIVGAVTGVGAQKIQNWAGTGTGTGTGDGTISGSRLPIAIETEAERQRQAELAAQQQQERSRKMVRNVIIGVVAVAVLGTVTYFVVKARKGKKGTAKK